LETVNVLRTLERGAEVMNDRDVMKNGNFTGKTEENQKKPQFGYLAFAEIQSSISKYKCSYPKFTQC
jgi:hypothetical protein